MDLTPAQRTAAFVVVVLALAGLGAFLLLPGGPAHRPAGGQPSHRAGPPPATPVATTPLASTPSGPGGPPPPTPSGPADIYQWLPFTQAGLTAAAAVVREFAADYGTFTYTEPAASYVGKMKPLITPELATVLARGYTTPGVAELRARQKQSATGSGMITALRAFGAASLTFVVKLAQQITSSSGTSRVSTDYAVTVTGSGATWQVSDIQLASAGNS